jgi:hypothetical protein
MSSKDRHVGEPAVGFRAGMEISIVRKLHTQAVLCHRWIHSLELEAIRLYVDAVPRIWYVTAQA